MSCFAAAHSSPGEVATEERPPRGLGGTGPSLQMRGQHDQHTQAGLNCAADRRDRRLRQSIIRSTAPSILAQQGSRVMKDPARATNESVPCLLILPGAHITPDASRLKRHGTVRSACFPFRVPRACFRLVLMLELPLLLPNRSESPPLWGRMIHMIM